MRQMIKWCSIALDLTTLNIYFDIVIISSCANDVLF